MCLFSGPMFPKFPIVVCKDAPYSHGMSSMLDIFTKIDGRQLNWMWSTKHSLEVLLVVAAWWLHFYVLTLISNWLAWPKWVKIFQSLRKHWNTSFLEDPKSSKLVKRTRCFRITPFLTSFHEVCPHIPWKPPAQPQQIQLKGEVTSASSSSNLGSLSHRKEMVRWASNLFQVVLFWWNLSVETADLHWFSCHEKEWKLQKKKNEIHCVFARQNCLQKRMCVLWLSFRKKKTWYKQRKCPILYDIHPWDNFQQSILGPHPIEPAEILMFQQQNREDFHQPNMHKKEKNEKQKRSQPNPTFPHATFPHPPGTNLLSALFRRQSSGGGSGKGCVFPAETYRFKSRGF